MCGFLKNELVVDLGYRYSRDTWRQGIGTEAAKVILNYVLKELALPSIISTLYTENIASEKILTKLGFVLEEKAFCIGKLSIETRATSQLDSTLPITDFLVKDRL